MRDLRRHHPEGRAGVMRLAGRYQNELDEIARWFAAAEFDGHVPGIEPDIEPVRLVRRIDSEMPRRQRGSVNRKGGRLAASDVHGFDQARSRGDDDALTDALQH